MSAVNSTGDPLTGGRAGRPASTPRAWTTRDGPEGDLHRCAGLAAPARRPTARRWPRWPGWWPGYGTRPLPAPGAAGSAGDHQAGRPGREAGRPERARCHPRLARAAAKVTAAMEVLLEADGRGREHHPGRGVGGDRGGRVQGPELAAAVATITGSVPPPDADHDGTGRARAGPGGSSRSAGSSRS